jgi:hypothetical protein
MKENKTNKPQLEKPTYEELVKIVKELDETGATAYQDSEDSVGYCVFCGGGFSCDATCIKTKARLILKRL